MSLHAGDSLGPYQVVELLGEGGMGTVYRAHDSRLKRDVAIKIIRADLAADPERIDRFEREARLLASLNHAHIATIHDLEEIGGTRFLVMELVEGVTLSERLRAGPVPVRETLRLALQIVEAIEAAHARNIIHRDLKPANIKLTSAGAIKVLDFGLAKALAMNPAATALAQSPTITADSTGAGIVLGTAAYMSPEQARGREVDKRTDVWAFGCVLFDMLAGKAAFAEDTVSDTLAAILTRDPDWSLLPPNLPPSISRLLLRCFQKEASRRLRDIGDARFEIEDALALSSDSGRQVAGREQAVVAGSSRTWHPSLLVLTGLAVGALIGAFVFAAFDRQPQAADRPVVRFAMALPDDQRVAALDFQALAISPNDDYIAYVGSRNGRQQLYLRALSALDSEPLQGTDGALEPFFSPDSKWIAFFAGGKLKKVPVGQGPVREIADAEIGFGGAWAPDGTIVFAPSNASGLMRVSAEGGPVQPVTVLDTARGEFSHRWPALLPDGKTVLFTIGTVGNWDDAAIASKQIDGREPPRILVQGGTYPLYLSNGQLLYAHGGTINTIAVARDTSEVAGASTKFLEDVLQSADGAAQFAVSRRGSVVYVPGTSAERGRTLVWVDRKGNVEPLAAPPQAYTSLRLSPDGRTVAATLAGTPEQIWTYSIADNRLTQFTHDGGSAPAWSSDGTRIFFSAARDGPAALFSRRTNSTVEQRLSRSDRVEVPQSASPDGALLFVKLDPDTGRDIWVLSADGNAQPLIATAANESSAMFSPDGQSFAIISDDTGRPEVFIAPTTNPDRRVQVSTAGGTEPVWGKDGTELFFRSGNGVMAVSVRARPVLTAGPPRQLFQGAFEKGASGSAAYDVSTDGMRFLMIRPANTERLGRELHVALASTGESPR